MRIAVCLVALLLLLPGRASATYFTIENLWDDAPVLTPGVGGPIWYTDLSVRTDEFDLSTNVGVCSSDYPLCDPTSFPIDVTHSNVIPVGQTFTSPFIPAFPEDQFFFSGLGVGGNGWFTGGSNVDAHYLLKPGVSGSDTLFAVWPYPDPAPVDNPYFPIAKITFFPGSPVPEPSALLLIGSAAVGLLCRRRA